MSDHSMTRLLPSFTAPATERIWLVAAHGGAGCTTIYREGFAHGVYADAGRALPLSSDPLRPAMAVLCARGTGRGLESLRILLSDWHEGRFGSTRLLGVSICAPCKHVPRQLLQGTALVGSGAPRVWRLPFIEGLELQGFPERYPKAYARMREQLVQAAQEEWAAVSCQRGQDVPYGPPVAVSQPINRMAPVLAQ